MAGMPAYRLDDYGFAEPQPRRSQPDITVIPGRGPAPQSHPALRTAALVLAAIVVILLAACAVRLVFSEAQITASNTYAELAMDVNAARAQGSSLEVQASNLSNPAYVRDYAAKKLGMAAPATVETMKLGADVVVQDADGALSLSGSLAAVARR